jgi:hypothetical protein
MSLILYETVLKYLFAFVNCLQGSFLFIYYFLLNEEVRRFLKIRNRNQYSRDRTETRLEGIEINDRISEITNGSSNNNIKRLKKSNLYKSDDKMDMEVEKTLSRNVSREIYNEENGKQINEKDKSLDNMSRKSLKKLKNLSKSEKKTNKKYNLSLNDNLVIKKINNKKKQNKSSFLK